MPDNKIEFQIGGKDDLSPILQAINQELAKVGQVGTEAGRRLAESFSKAGFSAEGIQGAIKKIADPQMSRDLQAYYDQITKVSASIKYLFEQRGGVETY